MSKATRGSDPTTPENRSANDNVTKQRSSSGSQAPERGGNHEDEAIMASKKRSAKKPSAERPAELSCYICYVRSDGESYTEALAQFLRIMESMF